MIKLLIRKYIKNNEDVDNISVKSSVGRLLGLIGIVFNLFLFGTKFLIGVLVQSVSIQADAINNLNDAINTIVTIVSFSISKRPADKEHPYGHERMEIISSFAVGMLILLFGFELLKDGVDSILHPKPIQFEYYSVFILILSICMKFYMYLYNSKYSKIYHSELLQATALDSISDVKGTVAILISTIVSPIIHFNLDGYMGCIVSLWIMWNAWKLIRDMIDSLLGLAPSDEIRNELSEEIRNESLFLDVHDLMIHSYGNKMYASAHVGVDANSDLFEIHDVVDHKERSIKDKMGIDLVLHIDPVKVNDPETIEFENKLIDALSKLNMNCSYHDFRVNSDDENVYLEFDLVVPYENTCAKEEFINKLSSYIQSDKMLHFRIDIDHPV